MINEANKPKILIVDDNNANIVTLTQILHQDYTLFTTKDGEHAIELAIKHKPNLILLDVLMPGMDGYEVLYQLKQDRKTHNIPVIFITGLDNPYDIKKGLASGAVDFLKKPFCPTTVKIKVNQHIL